MTTKDKRFPLPLSSVVNQKDKAGGGAVRHTAMPQTAMRNAAHHLSGVAAAKAAKSQQLNVPQGAAGSSAGLSPSLLSGPLVSEGVRRAMVARVAQQGVKDATVLAALQAVPRHLFLESGMASQAYVDASLPIGHHQTISQPYIVARMLEIMRNGGKLERVLEIGTGCGYQAAVLSVMVKEVYSIERIKALHELAKSNLRPMRIANIRLLYGDGMQGLPGEAPFDGIILAAAGMEVPQALLKQLRVGGRLVAPVGGRNQVLQLIERVSNYEWKSSVLESCHFVPLHPGVI
ncbi:protein-L-isoaspartate O-methyltransferase [Undibacterium sp. KW1]|jgi:protein-L-isoaspartate(D-aspartate) O-methyltransferase|uniref:protein-L-isoaspartate(D-aspartate) O-methyltransferase n=1 Tax=Undibacterium sp. KW1 TaxID=2058624 RepID=UPI001331E5FD|nr:protein-L-isoaspartate(D-aspartate) O-methyltransferase [Undibacterium sp. KW1]BBB60474.1 protein-L-isoaspartate O-methyltransferase [Undibacterium sp. KW1]